MYGANWVMQKYVIEQQTAIKTAVIIKTFADKLLLILFINSISHPSDCFYVVGGTELFSQVLNMRVNNPFLSKKLILSDCLQKVLPRQNPAPVGQQLPQYFKFTRGKVNTFSPCIDLVPV